jgi:hypothetical protein
MTPRRYVAEAGSFSEAFQRKDIQKEPQIIWLVIWTEH